MKSLIFFFEILIIYKTWVYVLNSEGQQIEMKFSTHMCGEYREHVNSNENFKILILKKNY